MTLAIGVAGLVLIDEACVDVKLSIRDGEVIINSKVVASRFLCSLGDTLVNVEVFLKDLLRRLIPEVFEIFSAYF